MHKAAIIILASCILFTLECSSYTPYYLRKDTYDYSKQRGRYVAIHRKAPNPEANGIIKGVVTDIDNGKSLPYVNVIVIGTASGTATNSEGYYEIEVYYPRKYQVHVRTMGYYPLRTQPIEVEKGKIVVLNFEMEVDTRPIEEPAGGNPIKEN